MSCTRRSTAPDRLALPRSEPDEEVIDQLREDREDVYSHGGQSDSLDQPVGDVDDDPLRSVLDDEDERNEPSAFELQQIAGRIGDDGDTTVPSSAVPDPRRTEPTSSSTHNASGSSTGSARRVLPRSRSAASAVT